MPVKIEDRPIKKIREEVIDQLVVNYAHQEITLQAFENRLDKALDTEDRRVLLEQVEDLELTADHQYQKTKAARLSEDEHFFDDDSEEYEKVLKVLSSSTQSGPWVVSEKMSVTSILSDFTLDFTDAIFEHAVVHIKLFNLLSSHTIFVPAGVRVVCKASSVLGSVNSRVFGSEDENAQTIVIHGKNILSSLDIKIRVTLKEKWLNFADGVKELLS
jgi:hypothetical protein